MCGLSWCHRLNCCGELNWAELVGFELLWWIESELVAWIESGSVGWIGLLWWIESAWAELVSRIELVWHIELTDWRIEMMLLIELLIEWLCD